jgi:hypothetical protein
MNSGVLENIGVAETDLTVRSRSAVRGKAERSRSTLEVGGLRSAG